MTVNDIYENQKTDYNAVVSHPLQAYEWGEFRKKTGIKVVRKGLYKNNKLTDAFQLTLHPTPVLPMTIGYLPKGNQPIKETISILQDIGKTENCVFIQLEPSVLADHKSSIVNHRSLQTSAHPLFTKYTFQLDITKSEDQLLAAMHPKTRYNIRVGQKKGVEIEENNSEKAFMSYLQLTQETTKRQGFYAHSQRYHRLMWETLNSNGKTKENSLSAHLLQAVYQKKILVSWIVFVFRDTLYYPYGASSNEHREVMASNLMMWEAIRFGKKKRLKCFDMWGALGPNPNPKDPWFGFHRFKQGYGATLVEFAGSFDLVTNAPLYKLYEITDKIRWRVLHALR